MFNKTYFILCSFFQSKLGFRTTAILVKASFHTAFSLRKNHIWGIHTNAAGMDIPHHIVR
jgi:hypothetical protein